MTDKPKKSTKAMKSTKATKDTKDTKDTKAMKVTQLEALNELVDKQTAQLNNFAALLDNLQSLLTIVTAQDEDEKCSCKSNGCSCKDNGCSCDKYDADPETKYTNYLEDLVAQWKGIQPEKPKSSTQPEQEPKRETNEQDKRKIYQKIHASHHPDFLTMLNNLDEFLNKTKRKCVCDCTDDWDTLKGSESEEYDNAFTRFSLDSNNDIIVDLSVSSGDCGYNITCTLDYDDKNYSINIITNELDKEVLDNLFMKITKSLDSFDADFTISDVTKIATKLYQLFDALS